MKSVHYRAVNGDRELFSLSRVAIPDNRVTPLLEQCFRETAHALALCGDIHTGETTDTAELRLAIVVTEYRQV